MRPEDEPYLIKVVRDRVGQSLVHTEHRIVYQRVDDAKELVEGLRRKLGEEAVEYMLKPGLDELVDILDTVQGLSRHDLQVPWEEVRAAATAKYLRRGAFGEGTGMYAVPIEDDDDGLELERSR
jgi:predicted house-cleaning noncanonical NTP pyrophosphatase (MazG superfamily)